MIFEIQIEKLPAYGDMYIYIKYQCLFLLSVYEYITILLRKNKTNITLATYRV